MKPFKTIILIRHATTLYNELDLLQGRMDNELNDSGIREAELLAKKLENEDVEVVIHSPMKRASQTAEIINRSHGVPCRTVEAFREIDLGDWEGLKYQEVIAENRDFHERWMRDYSLPIPGGESFLDVFNRVKTGVDEILDCEEQKIFIVGHATTNRGILGNLLKMDPASARLFRMKNGSYSKLLIFNNNGHIYTVVESWNVTGHLEKAQ